MLQTASYKRFTYISLLLSLLSTLSYSEITEYSEQLTKRVYPITTGSSSHYSIELMYPKAFEFSIQSYDGVAGKTGFCQTSPSKIGTYVYWTGELEPETSNTDTFDTEGEPEHYYDNIIYHEQTYFILDSVTFNITFTRDLTDPTSYGTIISDFKNDVDEDGRFEDAFLVGSQEAEVLYIVTRKKIYYYNVTEFLWAWNQQKPIPHITKSVTSFREYEDLLGVECYGKRLYIVADNIVDVFSIKGKGDGAITKEIQFNAEYFGTSTVKLTSIAFRGYYVYVLDNFRGVYLVDISQADKTSESDMRERYWFQANVILEITNGQSIQIVGNTLNVISSASKTPVLREYWIIGDPVFNRYEFNRQVDLYQGVLDTYADKNFLYLLTGYFNVVSKHGIPGRYQSENVKEHLTDYWPLFGTKAMVSLAYNVSSRVAAIHDNKITLFKVFERNPTITCDMTQATEGIHKYQVQAVMKDCAKKQKDKSSSFNSVCVVNQELELVVFKGTAQIGSVAKGKKMVLFLGISIGLMTIVVLFFVYLCRKYRDQYRKLEDEVKFQKLEEENVPDQVEIELGTKDKK